MYGGGGLAAIASTTGTVSTGEHARHVSITVAAASPPARQPPHEAAVHGGGRMAATATTAGTASTGKHARHVSMTVAAASPPAR